MVAGIAQSIVTDAIHEQPELFLRSSARRLASYREMVSGWEEEKWQGEIRSGRMIEVGKDDVDVVILTWNDGILVHDAVKSARESRRVRVRTAIVDNGSDPPASIDQDDVVLVRNSENRGVAPARNQGVRVGAAPLVCFLDSDARLTPTCLAALTARLLADASIGLAAPVFVDQPPEASAGRAPTFGRKAARALGLTAKYGRAAGAGLTPWWDVDFAIGACQLFRREAFEAVGGLDESIFYGPEDIDFCLRLRAAGWRVVQVADARCFHPPRRRNRRLFSARGMRHAVAVVRHLRRYRRP